MELMRGQICLGRSASNKTEPSSKAGKNQAAYLCGMELMRRSTCFGQWYRSGTSSPMSTQPACGSRQSRCPIVQH